MCFAITTAFLQLYHSNIAKRSTVPILVHNQWLLLYARKAVSRKIFCPNVDNSERIEHP